MQFLLLLQKGWLQLDDDEDEEELYPDDEEEELQLEEGAEQDEQELLLEDELQFEVGNERPYQLRPSTAPLLVYLTFNPLIEDGYPSFLRCAEVVVGVGIGIGAEAEVAVEVVSD
ncbi:MAG: hypothetical protein EZS28_021526 [Streblomastix strix]|uniref:Uncharacterized protein n=1 Tax=Streblomastix strix TaxID=222440 RepID=A0A5J4VK22_9EUKA|nr:MAG: hypothetical protein EZS28_021526 [Streblomastix strix]